MDEPLTAVDLSHDQAIVNGVRLHYVEAGDPDDPLVVCLHGFPEFWYSWRYQIPALVANDYHVVAPDLRGYNNSEGPHGIENYAIDHLLGDVVAIVHHCGADSAHVVGHDWGGAIAWALGLIQPDVIDHLVVMNAPHPAAFAREFDLEQLRRSWYVFFFQFPWLPEALIKVGNAKVIERVFRNQPANPAACTDADVERYREAFCRPGVPRSSINYYRAYFRDIAVPMATSTLPILRRFTDPPGNGEIPVPTLVCWGEQDEALGVGISKGLDEWVPDVRMERLPDASHWVQMDVPTEVNDAILDFLPEP